MEERTVTVTKRVTAAWQQAARTNGARAKEIVQSENHRAKLRAGQQARRARERAEREQTAVQAETGPHTGAQRAAEASPEGHRGA